HVDDDGGAAQFRGTLVQLLNAKAKIPDVGFGNLENPLAAILLLPDAHGHHPLSVRLRDCSTHVGGRLELKEHIERRSPREKFSCQPCSSPPASASVF